MIVTTTMERSLDLSLNSSRLCARKGCNNKATVGIKVPLVDGYVGYLSVCVSCHSRYFSDYSPAGQAAGDNM
jgi:hypothetical protein